MNKKILIGSIIAVVILILVSFTGVVGYQTTKSSTIAKASPLFTVRSSRAIDEDSKDFTCDYVGKDEETAIRFPISDNRNVLLQNVINIINKMDDEIFNRFVGVVTRHPNTGDKNDEGNVYEILQIIKETPDFIDSSTKHNDEHRVLDIWSIYLPYFPICYMLDVLSDIAWLIFIIVFSIITGTPWTSNCGPML